MKKPELPECTDINEKGVYVLEMEVRTNGTRSLVCPCCLGSSEHSSLPGNNPDNVDYPCRTCDGAGDLDKVIPINGERQKPGRGPAWEPAWAGAEISSRLAIRPSSGDGWWNIHGGQEAQNGMGDSKEVMQLVHLILEHLEPAKKLHRLQWVKDYRKLNPAAGLQHAMEAWNREHPGSPEDIERGQRTQEGDNAREMQQAPRADAAGEACGTPTR